MSELNKERCYKILGLTHNATKEEIKNAYRAKVKINHPDKFHGTHLERKAASIFNEINEAYNILMGNNKAQLSKLEEKRNQAMEHNRRGEVYRIQNQFDAAIKEINEALRLDPAYDIAYVNRGEVYRMQNKFDAAIKDFNEAIKINPKISFAYGGRGEIYRMRNQFDLALKDFNEAIRLNPNFGFFYGCRGLIFRYYKQKHTAIQDYEKALSLNKDLEWVKMELQEIQKKRISKGLFREKDKYDTDKFSRSKRNSISDTRYMILIFGFMIIIGAIIVILSNVNIGVIINKILGN